MVLWGRLASCRARACDGVQVKARTAELGLGPEEHAKKIPMPRKLLKLVKKATEEDFKSKKEQVSTMFMDDLIGTLDDAVHAYSKAREGFEMQADLPGDPFLEYICGLQAFTPEQLLYFLELAFLRYDSKSTEPSTPIGAIAAQVWLHPMPLRMLLWGCPRLFIVSNAVQPRLFCTLCIPEVHVLCRVLENQERK